MTDIAGFAGLVDKYDAFVFDLWGVTHDGVALFPGVMPTLLGLRRAGKKIGFLSNSPRPAASARRNLVTQFGLTSTHFDSLLTSGQMLFEALRDRPDDWLRTCGTRCLHVGPDDYYAAYDGIGLQRVKKLSDVDFIFLTRVDENKSTLADYATDLERWRQADRPMVCANPDRHVIHAGDYGMAIGAVAEAYAALGGRVRNDFGKPYPAIFQRVLTDLGTKPDRTLMVGDNLDTDIAGAAGAGMPSLWITRGVHAPALDSEHITTPDGLASFAARHQQQPTHTLSVVTW